MDTCRQCGSRSAAGHRRRSMIWQIHFCAGLHYTGLDLSAETMCGSEIKTRLLDNVVSYISVVDHSSSQLIYVNK